MQIQILIKINNNIKLKPSIIKIKNSIIKTHFRNQYFQKLMIIKKKMYLINQKFQRNLSVIKQVIY